MRITEPQVQKFRREIRTHYRLYGRDFPWRRTKNPYKILVSEMMLQQTQTSRVFQKYEAFLKIFPSFAALAAARISDVLAAWQGLGYNRRALALKRLSEIVAGQYRGKLPRDQKELMKLPGVGSATAGAIAAFAFQLPVPFIETNIRRVFLHFFFAHKKRVSDADILGVVEATLDARNPREWYYALMDYGAMLALRMPRGSNPNRRSARYRKQSSFLGSTRQLRGNLVRLLVERGSLRAAAAAKELSQPLLRVRGVIAALENEGFVRKVGEKITLMF